MNISEDVANILLEVGAFKYYQDHPFEFVSGILSPIYFDCRKIISYPLQRRKIIQYSCEIVKEKIGTENIDVIAGGETAGIPFAYGLAEELDKPMIYVRKEPKGHGTHSQIEGELNQGERVLLFEDLIFNAGSKINFFEGIVRAGGVMEHILVVFEYGVKGSVEALEKRGIKLWNLTDWEAFFKLVTSKGYLTQEENNEVKRFLENPEKWDVSRGS